MTCIYPPFLRLRLWSQFVSEPISKQAGRIEVSDADWMKEHKFQSVASNHKNVWFPLVSFFSFTLSHTNPCHSVQDGELCSSRVPWPYVPCWLRYLCLLTFYINVLNAVKGCVSRPVMCVCPSGWVCEHLKECRRCSSSLVLSAGSQGDIRPPWRQRNKETITARNVQEEARLLSVSGGSTRGS